MAVRFTLRELDVFCAIARQENVHRAAETLALTQSAASQALARLEESLGRALFDRHGRRLVLNENGRLLLPRAQALLDQAEELPGLLGVGGEGNSAPFSLQIAASTTIANYLVPAQLAALRRAHPQARVALTVGNTGEVVAAVAALEVDFGLIEGPSHHPQLHIEPWREDDLIVFAAATHALASGNPSLQDLADAPWLLREAGSGTREEVERSLLPLLGRLNVDMELGDSEAIKRAVAAGLGVSCLSSSVVADLLAQGAVVALTDRVPGLPPLKRMLHCIRHRDRAITRGTARFLEIAAADTR
ncbi:LysR family transcriptional regulator [Hylemonella gracilis]|uniref:Putative DNA-binding transcriptional regulator n=1 Tax=Hylemonella gracilis ATCC 19624 TaxID=887062 RepID=F3KTZ3_9BURK|nr:LysR family transcriptional regulator [Hylemonella gracilis]EGI76745.1 putative DNA-binding transcriptional regulator [Hylemonella gracilis ATCC 19624]